MKLGQAGTGSILIALVLALFGSAAGQSLPGQGQGAMWTTPDNVGSTQAVIYADAFPASIGDACQRINAALLALPVTGGVVDARGFQGAQACASNPFAGIAVSGMLLLGNAAYSIAVPWTIPAQFRVYGGGRGNDITSSGTALVAAAGFGPVTNLGSVTITSGTSTVTGTGFTTSMIGGLFYASGTSVFQSTVAGEALGTQLILSTIPQVSFSSTATLTPAMVQFLPTATGSTSFGVSISNLQIDCASVGNGMGIQNWWAEELSYVQDVNISNCYGIALDVETIGAQNSGPYANIAVGQTGTTFSTTLCAELLATGDLRGLRGLTCTSNATLPSTGPAVGVDLSTPSITVEDVHLEGYLTGIEVAANSSSSNRINGVVISNISGGSNGTTGMTSLVDVFNNPSFAGATEVSIFGLSAPVVTSTQLTNLLNDHVMGTIVPFATERSLAYYVLGRVVNGTRLRLTSSANAANAPNVVPSVTQAYTKGTTFTAQNLGCFSALSTISDCASAAPNTQFVGVNATSPGSLALVQTLGDVTVNLDGTTANVAFGDYICVSPTVIAKAKATSTTPCTQGSGIGVSAQSLGLSPTSIIVHLRPF